jgi:hypothetical protein
MSRIGDIRTALASVITAANGVKTVNPYPPEQVTTNGTVWIGFFDDAVTFSNRELHLYTVPVAVIVNRNARLGQALKDTEPVIDTILAQIRVHQKLGLNDVMRTEVTRVRQGTIKVGDVDFVGFEITLVIKESFGATLSP